MAAGVCAECGKSFEHKASQARVCCSRGCAARHRNRRLVAEGRLYLPTKPRRGETHPCEQCGKPVYRNKSQAAKGEGRYCSHACHDAAQTKTPVVKACAYCGATMTLKPSQAHVQYCSKACEGAARTKRPLDREHNGKPARLDPNGYVLLWEPQHPNKSMKGWQYEHRLVMEQALGRYLDSSEHVHHDHGVAKDDNRIENLVAMDGTAHILLSGVEYRETLRRERAELAEYRRRYGPLEEE